MLSETSPVRRKLHQTTRRMSGLSRSRFNPLRPEFVYPGHFYSAIADTAEAFPRHAAILARDPRDLPGIDLHVDRQWNLLAELDQFLGEMPFGEGSSASLRYRFDNGSFAHGDGTVLYLMLRWLRPHRVVEVGSGYSTACMLDTIERFLGDSCALTCIDPFDGLLRSLMRKQDSEVVRIFAKPVQDIDLTTFSSLDAGDLLFIDSTHVSKVGSDVNFLLFDVLPTLKPGVVIHIHDVFPRFEYPWAWVHEGRVWQEDYLLRAFLQFNNEFEVLLWPNFLAEIDGEGLFERLPTIERDIGSSIYLRRRGGEGWAG